MNDKIKELKSQIEELDKQIGQLVEENKDDKLIGNLELKRQEYIKQLQELEAAQEQPKPKTLKEKLMALVSARVKTQNNLYKIGTKLKEEEQKHIMRQYELQVILDEMASSDDPEVKKRFSSADKRKFEFQLLYNNDKKIKEILTDIKELKDQLGLAEAIDKIQKIDERYLFKLIDLEINSPK